ncbi:MAG TPA: hypothetical protein VK961_25285 [Chthoniobacter sp.]|nr:hypothetical protein [Chthoniobacter sp.]
MKINRILELSTAFVLLGTTAFPLLTGCASHHRGASATSIPAAKKEASTYSNPARTIAARWARNEAGDAVKDFKHATGTYLRGEVYGYWPEGATYEASRINAGARTLHLQVDTKEPSEGNEYHHFSAEVSFDAAERRMTMVRHNSNHIPDEKLTYYKAP